jgi:hypothetical protein
MTYTITQAAEEAPLVGLIVHAAVHTGHGSGLLLSGRLAQPGVLGFGAIGLDGTQAVLALDEDEAAALRDALDEWLETRRG